MLTYIQCQNKTLNIQVTNIILTTHWLTVQTSELVSASPNEYNPLCPFYLFTTHTCPGISPAPKYILHDPKLPMSLTHFVNSKTCATQDKREITLKDNHNIYLTSLLKLGWLPNNISIVSRFIVFSFQHPQQQIILFP